MWCKHCMFWVVVYVHIHNPKSCNNCLPTKYFHLLQGRIVMLCLMLSFISANAALHQGCSDCEAKVIVGRCRWSLSCMSQTLRPYAPVLLKAAYFLPCFSPCIRTAAPPVISLLNSWSSQRTTSSLGSSQVERNLPTRMRLTIWQPGAETRTWG